MHASSDRSVPLRNDEQAAEAQKANLSPSVQQQRTESGSAACLPSVSLLLVLSSAAEDVERTACLQDKNPDNRSAAEAKFKDISEAYEVSRAQSGSLSHCNIALGLLVHVAIHTNALSDSADSNQDAPHYSS